MVTAAVTGADGFIGSHLVELLVARGYHVRAMVQYNSVSSWGWLEDLSSDALAHVDVIPGDVRDSGCVLDLFRGATTAYHLAALIAIPYSYRAPRSYFSTNVSGTLNVLEAGRTLGTPRLVITSTSEVYGTARTIPITEDHPLQAQSPYAASKIASDKLGESYHLSFGCPVVTLRPFNTYGPRQSARAVLPSIITQIVAGQHEVRLGSLAPTRDLNYVADTAEAFLAVGTAPADAVVGRVFNAGSGTETPIAALVQMVATTLGTCVDIVLDEQRLRPAASEVMRLVSDSTRLSEACGWKPWLSLSEGLERTCDFFLQSENRRRYRHFAYNI